MNREVNIHVEGKGDLVFLCHFIKRRFSFDLKIDNKCLSASSKSNGALTVNVRIIDTEDNGNGGINNKKISDLIHQIENVDSKLGIETVLLLDTDTPTHTHPRGGVVERTKYLDGLVEISPFDYFLIPNHKDDGNLENLLDQIVCERGKPFYACLKSYIKCLSSLTGDNIPKHILKITDFQKKQMEWYTFMMLDKGGKNTGTERDYSEDIWDLKSEVLDPLYGFLEKKIFYK